MAVDWSNISFTPAQRQALAALEAYGNNARQDNHGVPPLTYSQLKQASSVIASLGNSLNAVSFGIKAAMIYYRDKAVKDFDAANP